MSAPLGTHDPDGPGRAGGFAGAPASAEDLLASAGVRVTPIRRAVLLCLLRVRSPLSHGELSAYPELRTLEGRLSGRSSPLLVRSLRAHVVPDRPAAAAGRGAGAPHGSGQAARGVRIVRAVRPSMTAQNRMIEK